MKIIRKHFNPLGKIVALGALIAGASFADAQVIATNWAAFNDHNLTGMPAPGTGPNTTVYKMDTGPGGPLKDHFTGAELEATLVVIPFGITDNFGASDDPNPGSPAYELFNGIVDVGGATGASDEGIVGLRAGQNGSVTLVFTNLDTSKRYIFRGTSIRGGDYPNRWAFFAIEGADSYTDAHADGSANRNIFTQATFPGGTLTAGQVALNSGDNRAGSLVGWDDIVPGPDGSFSVVGRQYTGPATFGNSPPDAYGYGLNAIMLAEVGEPVPVAILTHPEPETTVLEVRPFTLSVTAEGSPAPQYQWHRVGVGPIAGATFRNYTVATAALEDDAEYFVVVSNPLNTVTSTVARVIVTADTEPPVPLSAAALNGTTIGILFDELLDPASIPEQFNYTVVSGVDGFNPQTASLHEDGRTVILQMAVPVETFSVHITGLRDLSSAGNMLDDATIEGANWASARDIVGPADPASPTQPPGSSVSSSMGDVDVIAGGADIWGPSDEFHFVYQTRTGDFDVNVKVQRLDPANNWSKAGLLARETLDGNSRTIEAYTTPDRPPGTRTYEAGRRPEPGAETVEWGTRPPTGLPNAWIRLRRVGDAFTAFHGTDGVNWSVFAGPVTQVMEDELFVGMATTSHDITRITTAEYRDFQDTSFPGAVVTITQQPVDQTVDQHSRVTFSGNASISGAPAAELILQWQRSDDDGATWSNIRGANSATYSIQFPTQAEDDQALFRLVASVPGESAESSAARLTVGEDNTPPRLLFVVGISPTSAIAYFSEPMHPDASEPFGFMLDQGAAVGNAQVNETNATRIDLTIPEGAPLVLGSTYTLTVNAGWGITDVGGNEVAPPASAQFLAQIFDGDPDTLLQLPPERALPLDSLADRGFQGRLVMNAGIAAGTWIDVGESALAGTLINPLTGLPYDNLAPVPEFIETGIINYEQTGMSQGQIPGDVRFPGMDMADPDNFAMEVLTYLELHPGIVRMGVNSDDGFRVRLATGHGDPEAIILGEFPAPRGAADTVFDFLVTEPGLYPFRLTWQENAGGANVEWWIQDLATMEYVAVNARDDIKAFLPPAGVDEPELAIELNAATDEAVISWPASAAGFRLQRTLSLSEPSWSDVADTPVDLGGGRIGVTLSVNATETAYFRLEN